MSVRNPVKRAALAVLGAVLLAAGALLLVLPGPGMLLVFAGLVALSAAFPRLERRLEPVRTRALQAADAGVASPLHVAGSVLTAAVLLGAGVAWGLVPTLPMGGWATGSALISSGAVLIGLLVYSGRRRAARRAPRQP